MNTIETKEEDLNLKKIFKFNIDNFSETPKLQTKYIFIPNHNDNSLAINIAKSFFYNFSNFKDLFYNENINIKDEKALFDFFINNNFLDTNILKIFLKLIKDSFTNEREIIVDYDSEYKKSLCFCIRENEYNDLLLNKLISSFNNKIIDMLEDDYPNSGFNIIIYTDFEKASSLNNKRVNSGI